MSPRYPSPTTDELVDETYAAHYIIGAFGYEPENMFVHVGPAIGETVVGDNSVPGRCVVFTLRVGERSFVLPIAPVSRQVGRGFVRAWLEFANVGKRAASVRELDAMVHRSTLWRRRQKLVTALALKGFELKPLEAFG